MPPSPEAEVPDADDLEVQRVVIRFAAALIALLLAAGIGAALSTTGDGDDPTVAPSDLDGSSIAGGIGPQDDVDIRTYAARRRAALATVSAPRAAVVSVNRYLTEAEARVLLGRVPGPELRSFLVAAPGGEVAVVEGDLDSWRADVQRTTREERDEIAKLLPSVTDPDFVNFYESEVARLDGLLVAIETAPIVFGAVVVGDGDELRSLAGVPEVRLVDPGASRRIPPQDRIRGLRPEETVTAGDPPTRPLLRQPGAARP